MSPLRPFARKFWNATRVRENVFDFHQYCSVFLKIVFACHFALNAVLPHIYKVWEHFCISRAVAFSKLAQNDREKLVPLCGRLRESAGSPRLCAKMRVIFISNFLCFWEITFLVLRILQSLSFKSRGFGSTCRASRAIRSFLDARHSAAIREFGP